MFDVCRVERQIGGRLLSIETGKVAKQADGAVIVQYGDTVVLVAVVTAPPRSEDIDFFPLSVEYREKHCAAGKFPGGFTRRKGRTYGKQNSVYGSDRRLQIRQSRRRICGQSHVSAVGDKRPEPASWGT